MNIVIIWCSFLLRLLRLCSCNKTEPLTEKMSNVLLNLNTGHTVIFSSTIKNMTSTNSENGTETSKLLAEDLSHSSLHGEGIAVRTRFYRSLSGPQISYDQSEENILIEATVIACGVDYLCLNHSVLTLACGFTCSSCKCDSACHRYGDCCADILDKNDTIQQYDQFEYSSCEEPEWTSFQGETTAAAMVIKCPLSRSLKDDVVTKCEQPDITVKTQATQVSDVETLITYRNKFCAMCHAIDNYREWTHTVSCLDADVLNNVTSNDGLWRAILIANCDMVSLPPEGVPVHRCLPTTINSCNATGRWWNPDNAAHLVALCNFYIHPVVYYYQKYKNVFCALCNGARISYNCKPNTPVPFPLSVLLSFDSQEDPEREAVEQSRCDHDEVFNPFAEKCSEVKCQSRQLLRDGRCEFLFSSTRGLGFELSILLTSSNGAQSATYDLIAAAYYDALLQISGLSEVFIIHYLQITPLITDFHHNVSNPGTLAQINVVSISDVSLNIVDKYFTAIKELSFLVLDRNGQTEITSTYSDCPVSFSLLSNNTINVPTSAEMMALSVIKGCNELWYSCLYKVHYDPILVQLDCPFVEFNLSLSNFTFDIVSHNLTFDNLTVSVNRSRVYICGEVLRMCSDVLEDISSLLHQPVTQLVLLDVQTNDPVLAMFSLVCLSLSLLGLLLTFIVYSILPELRTLPGKITMLLIFHLFVAQLLFLVGSNNYNRILCQAMGILIHYFWLTSFMWMMSAALHMYRLFTNIWMTAAVTPNETTRTIVRYCIICHVIPMVIVGCSVTYHTFISQASDIGYGGKVCFVRGFVGIGVFFVSPLLIMLLFNLICFVQTVRVIRSVPDMASSSNKQNRTFLFVYLKLSILLGFSWLFGLLDSAFELVVVEYIFVFLTGSQGLLIFVSFCLMGRSLEMMKKPLCPFGKKLDSGIPSTKSSD